MFVSHNNHDETNSSLVGIDLSLEDTGKVKSSDEPLDSKLGLFTFLGLFIAFCQVCCEVFKQISNYSLQYYNGGHYPIPQTAMIVMMEAIKLSLTVVRSKGNVPSFSISSLRSSLRFLLPSVLYALNNNIYFFGLILVSPPIWLILCSFRTVVTVSVYKFILRRQVTSLQSVGAVFIVLSIAIAKAPDIIQAYDDFTSYTFESTTMALNSTLSEFIVGASTVNVVPVSAILLAMVASCNSVGAAVYTESLFKSAGENFLHQQFWLYLYGGLMALIVHFISYPAYNLNNLIDHIKGMSSKLELIFFTALLFGSVGGLVVAAILKVLDNIVKEYTCSLANILTGVACSILFPDKFAFTIHIVFSMLSLLTGIYLYETKHL